MKPFFSIGIPVYNEEMHIENTIKSIQAQDIDDFEIICIDDCSTDNSLDKLEILSSMDNRIKVYHNDTNRGIAYTRERIAYLANGLYFLWCDSDDRMEEGCLYSLKKEFEKYPGKKVVIIQNARIVNNKKSHTVYKYKSTILDIKDTAKRVAIGNKWYSYPWTFVGNTALFKTVHYPPNARIFVDDQLVSYMYMDQADVLYYFDRVNYSHFLYDKSDSHNPTFYQRLSNTYHYLSERTKENDFSYKNAVIMMEKLNMAWFYAKKEKSDRNKYEVKRLSDECSKIAFFRSCIWLETKYRLIGALFVFSPSLFYLYYNYRKLL